MSPAPSIEFERLFLSRTTVPPVEILLALASSSTQDLLDEVLKAEKAVESGRSAASDALFLEIPRISDPKARSQLLNLRRRVHTAWTPFMSGAQAALGLLSPETVQKLESLNDSVVEHGRLIERWKGFYEQDLSRARSRLRECLNDPLVQEGIFLSSRRLLEGVRRYLNPGWAERHRKDAWDLECSLVEHLTRACMKTTPRGVLASVGLGHFDQGMDGVAREDRSMAGRAISRRKTVLPLFIVEEILKNASWRGDAWKFVKPRPNPTLRVTEDGISFWRRDDKEEVLCRMPAHPLLLGFLERTYPRAHTAQEVLDGMARDWEDDIDPDELAEHYRKLCAQGFLIGHLEVPFSENDGVGFFLRWARELSAGAVDGVFVAQMTRLQQGLARLDEIGFKFGPEKEALYSEIHDLVVKLLPEGWDTNDIFIVDAVSAAEDLRFGRDVEAAVKKALESLWVLSGTGIPDAPPDVPLVSQLREQFPGRSFIPIMEFYEKGGKDVTMDRTLPKFPKPYIAQFLASLGPRGETGELDLEASGIRQFLSERAARKGTVSGAMLFHVLADSVEELNKGDFQIVCHDLCFPYIASRWAYLFPGEGSIEGTISNLLAPRQDGIASASLLYRYGGFMDTAGCTPSYYPYEIEVFGVRSNLPVERLIPLKDLGFALGAGPEEMRFAWKKGEELIPIHPRIVSLVIPNKDVFTDFVAIAGMLFRPTQDGMPIDWGYYKIIQTTHRPRVTWGNVVLFREKWQLKRPEMPDIQPAEDPQFMLACARWRRKWGMPRFVFMRRVDKKAEHGLSPWLVDFCNPFHIRTLRTELRKGADPECIFEIMEALPSPEQLWDKGSAGTRAHETIVHFRLKA